MRGSGDSKAEAPTANNIFPPAHTPTAPRSNSPDNSLPFFLLIPSSFFSPLHSILISFLAVFCHIHFLSFRIILNHLQNGRQQLPRPSQQPYEAGVALQAQHRDGSSKELPPYLHHRNHWYVLFRAWVSFPMVSGGNCANVDFFFQVPRPTRPRRSMRSAEVWQYSIRKDRKGYRLTVNSWSQRCPHELLSRLV